MQIGIAGLGVVGGAFARWLSENTDHDVRSYDPRLGLTDDLRSVNALFICVPVPTEGRAQNLSIVREILEKFGGPNMRIFIRSSVVPGTCDHLSREFGLEIYAMPEFLTERTADTDVRTQRILCGRSYTDAAVPQYAFLSQIFNGAKDIVLMTNVEAELAKYAHNGWGTTKVHFSNIIFELCQKLGADYEKVRFGALMSGYVSQTHTQVPGPDGKLGYGGKCFPKDMEALIGLLLSQNISCDSLSHMQAENEVKRCAGL